MLLLDNGFNTSVALSADVANSALVVLTIELKIEVTFFDTESAVAIIAGDFVKSFGVASNEKLNVDDGVELNDGANALPNIDGCDAVSKRFYVLCSKSFI